MLCRAVVAVLALSYLICVLWLSGLQKEDLDVNILRKLQRHNVNIDDKNQDSLREDCLKSEARTDSRNEEKNVTADYDETKITPVIQESDVQIKAKSEDTEPVNWSTMLDTFMDTEKSNYKDSDATKNLETVTSRLKDDGEQEKGIEKTETSIPSKNTERSLQNLQDVINFWNMFTTPQYMDHTVSKTTPKKIMKIKPKNKLHKIPIEMYEERNSKEMEQINKLLADYFYKNLKPSTTQNTVISSADLSNLNKLTQQLDNFFKIISKSKLVTKNDDADKKDSVKKLSGNYAEAYDNVDYIDSNIPQQTYLVRASKKEHTELDPKNHQDIRHLLLLNDKLKKSIANETNSALYQITLIEGPPDKNKKVYEAPRPVTPTINHATLTANSIGTPSEAFSKDVIEKLAENVKEKVLKDLRHEIISSTPETTMSPMSIISHTSAILVIANSTTSTIAAMTQKPLENKTKEENGMLKVIMELVKELKAFKDRSSTTSDRPKTFQKFESSQIQNPNVMPMQMNPYKIKQQPENTLTLIKSYENQKSLEMNAPMNPRGNIWINRPINNSNSFLSMNSMKGKMMDPYKVNRLPDISSSTYKRYEQLPEPTEPSKSSLMNIENPQLSPSKKSEGTAIIQTNSQEIAPLGIPLSKPFQLIHQNIVVTTTPANILFKPKHWALNRHTKTNRDKTRNRLESYRYSNKSQHYSMPVNREANHMTYNSHPSQVETIASKYIPYTSHGQSRLPHRYTNRAHFIPNSSQRDAYRLQYDSNLLKSNTIRPNYDLKIPHYDTPIPRYEHSRDNDDARDKLMRQTDQEFNSKPRSVATGIGEVNIDYSPQYEMNFKSKIDRNSYEDKNRKPDKLNKAVERFHEKLERVDNWRDETPETKELEKCCENLDLASRQQLALNTYKTRYDDTHFKNFLKTQQKVNEMLEKMLSSKPHGRSVEVI